MQNSFFPHAQFFASLKHLERRLKLENHEEAETSTLPPPPPPPPPAQIERRERTNDTQQTDSLGTPIYLLNQSATVNSESSNIQESEAPQEFLSRPLNPPPTNQSPPHEPETLERVVQQERLDLDDDDDIGLLMQLLRLSDSEVVNEREGVNNAGCDDEFYDRIVGVKGPKNVKELESLEKWIKHFINGEKKEPFRLVNLLLGKAAFLHYDGGGDGLGGLLSPSTIKEFLQNDPPID